MELDTTKTPETQQGLTAIGRAARRDRILDRLCMGWGYDEVAREERLSTECVRQFVKEILKERRVDDSSTTALVQLARPAPAIRAAGRLL